MGLTLSQQPGHTGHTAPNSFHDNPKAQRDIRASMSACMRSPYSSDQRAPNFSLLVLRGSMGEGVLPSRGDFRVPGLSFRVTRGVEGWEAEFEWLIGC
jgi:hypothetical protein